MSEIKLKQKSAFGRNQEENERICAESRKTESRYTWVLRKQLHTGFAL